MALENLKNSWWFWWRQVFNWWALILPLMVFLPLGFYSGYEVRQPSLVMEATQDLLKRLREVEAFLVKAEIDQPMDIANEAGKLTDTITETKAALEKLSSSSTGLLQSKLDTINRQVEAIQTKVRAQNIKYDSAISQQIGQIRQLEYGLHNKVDASKDTTAIVFDQLRRFLKWIGAISFLTIVAVVLFIVMMSTPKIRSILAKSGSISAFGLTFNFNDLQSVRASIAERETKIESDAAQAYITALRSAGVERLFRQVMQNIEQQFTKLGVTLQSIHHRATLYVPGFVGENLVQATRYSGNWNLKDETVVGRRFSVRYGIIGKAWRLRSCQYNPNVHNENKDLIRDWGFTEAEAIPFQPSSDNSNVPRASLMAFVLTDIGSLPPLGLIYLEAEGANVLHTDNVLTSGPELEQVLSDGSGLTRADKYASESIWEKINPNATARLRSRLVRLQSELRWNDKIEGGVGR
jgi:hypothetical protein